LSQFRFASGGRIVPILIVCGLSAPRGSDTSAVCTLSAPHGPSAPFLLHVVCSARFRRIGCLHVVCPRFRAQFVCTRCQFRTHGPNHIGWLNAFCSAWSRRIVFSYTWSASHCSNTSFVCTLSAPHGSNTLVYYTLRAPPARLFQHIRCLRVVCSAWSRHIVFLTRCLRRMVPIHRFCSTLPAPHGPNTQFVYTLPAPRMFFPIHCPALNLAPPATSTLRPR